MTVMFHPFYCLSDPMSPPKDVWGLRDVLTAYISGWNSGEAWRRRCEAAILDAVNDYPRKRKPPRSSRTLGAS